MRLLIKRLLLAGLVIGLLTAIFRHGLIPARWTPLPRLDLANPMPLVVDWQLAELRYDRRLCREMLQSTRILKARPIKDRPLVKGCGWTNAVSISKMSGARLRVGRLSCQAAAATALWVANVVQPASERIFGERVSRITNYGTYSCRNIIGNALWRDRRSEHATANAIDISAFRLRSGRRISVLKDWSGGGRKAEFLRAIHDGACTYFRVALSPRFNAAHKDHFHFDRGWLWRCY